MDQAPLLFRPVAHIRSPLAERRSIELAPPDPDRRSLAVPSPRTLIRLAASLLRPRGQASFGFGDGFLPFRAQTGWPLGVQEDDEVHWNWSPGSPRDGVRD